MIYRILTLLIGIVTAVFVYIGYIPGAIAGCTCIIVGTLRIIDYEHLLRKEDRP